MVKARSFLFLPSIFVFLVGAGTIFYGDSCFEPPLVLVGLVMSSCGIVLPLSVWVFDAGKKARARSQDEAREALISEAIEVSEAKSAAIAKSEPDVVIVHDENQAQIPFSQSYSTSSLIDMESQEMTMGRALDADDKDPLPNKVISRSEQTIQQLPTFPTWARVVIMLLLIVGGIVLFVYVLYYVLCFIVGVIFFCSLISFLLKKL